PEVIECHRARGVCPNDEIDVAHDDVSCTRVATRFRRQNLLADRLAVHARSVRAIHAAPTRLPIVFTVVRHMSNGRSTAATSAIAAAARGPSPIALRTMSV